MTFTGYSGEPPKQNNNNNIYMKRGALFANLAYQLPDVNQGPSRNVFWSSEKNEFREVS